MSIPEPSVLLESPLDAPPIVLFQAPKPPPSDETWAQLRTDLTPKRDVLMEEVHAERRSRGRWIFTGFALAVLAKARWRLSLGAMTLPHRLARLILAEQVYRAFSIIRGEPYNK